MHGITRLLGILSMVQFAFGTSGEIDTQLSSAISGPGVEPPQIMIVKGLVYGACWGMRTAEPSKGYVRPPRKLLTAAGILGRVRRVLSEDSSRMRASL